MTILIVDDEPAVPRLFEQWFRKELRDGLFQFSFAGSGEAALALLDGGFCHPAIVLTDINMPGMTGLELLDAIQSRSLDLPVYMVSAYDGSELEAQALARGAAGFFPKPLRFGRLLELFLSVLGSDPVNEPEPSPGTRPPETSA